MSDEPTSAKPVTDKQISDNTVGHEPITDFERAASQSGASLIREFWYFLSNNKKWWLLPILIILLLFGALMLLSGTALAPFIYTLF
jgi:hypothetical protein